MIINLGNMTTEARNIDTMNLDSMTSLEIVTVMNEQDLKIPAAIKPHLESIACIVDLAVQAIESGGRIIYMGAGTSGRLGVLDAAECPPTFGVGPDMVIGLIAGGERAFIKAQEGAEDNESMAVDDLKAIHLESRDIVIGLAASGRTPYVIGGLNYAKSIGCHTAGITCNENSEVGKTAEIAIDVLTGPEVLTGSTRLKAGTAQKMILNMISTATMVGIGKTYGNLMIDVLQTNAKLRVRAENIVMQVTGVDRDAAREAIDAAGGSCKVAVTMILTDCNKEEALLRLEAARGHVRRALH